MEIKVEYTVELTKEEVRGIGWENNEEDKDASKAEIKDFLKHNGISLLGDMYWEGSELLKEEKEEEREQFVRDYIKHGRAE